MKLCLIWVGIILLAGVGCVSLGNPIIALTVAIITYFAVMTTYSLHENRCDALTGAIEHRLSRHYNYKITPAELGGLISFRDRLNKMDFGNEENLTMASAREALFGETE